jgi:hypothetical protein
MGQWSEALRERSFLGLGRPISQISCRARSAANQDTLGVRQKQRARSRQQRPALRSLEKSIAELFLQFQYLLTKRGLGDEVFLGPATECSRPCDGGKVPQLMHP